MEAPQRSVPNRTCCLAPLLRMRRFAPSAGPSCRGMEAATSAAIVAVRVGVVEGGTVKAMYERGFVAGILAGFEETLEALMGGVDEDARRELGALSGQIERTRLHLDLDPHVEGDGECEADEQYLRTR